MTVSLRPLTDDERRAWLDAQLVGYIAERVRAGETPEEARRVADRQHASLFPGGVPAPGHLLSRVMDDGTPVGWLWIGPHSPERPHSYWIWDIVIDEEFRGGGRGRATMVLAEQSALAAGATDLGLNVYGHNLVARHLYESLGYDTVSLQMRKALDATDAGKGVAP